MSFTITSQFGKRWAGQLEPWMRDDLARFCDAIGSMFDPVLELVEEWGADGTSVLTVQNEIPNPSFVHDGKGGAPAGWKASSSYRINSGATAQIYNLPGYPQASSIFGLISYVRVEAPGISDFEGLDTGEVIQCVEGTALTVFISLYDEVTQTTELRLGSAACGLSNVTIHQTSGGGWKRHSITLNPSASGLAGFSVSTHPTAEQVIIFTAVSTVEPYVDGDSYGYFWTGGKGNSVSRNLPAFIPAWGKLLDPDLCPTAFLPYLGQFVGVEVPKVMPEAEARALIKEEPMSRRARTTTIEAAVRRSLSGEKLFQVVERRNAAGNEDPDHFLILIYNESELPSLKALEANVNRVKPWGIFYTVIVGELTYSVLEAAHETYAELEAAHTTYADMEAHPTA